MDQVLRKSVCRMAALVFFTGLFTAYSAFAAPKKLAQWKMSGLIADLDLSANGSRILVAIVPDREQPGDGKSFLALLNRSGKKVWQRPVTWPIRTQTLSADGKLAIVSTYDGKLTAIGSSGKTLWEQEETCRPYVLKNRQVLCYHDEDSAPDIAFDIFDGAGKKKASFPIQGDILAFALSPDERNLALALTGGRIVLIEYGKTKRGRIQPRWEKKLDTEVIDIAVGSGRTPVIAGISRGQFVVLNAKGDITARVPLDYSAQAVRLSEDSRRALIQGERMATKSVPKNQILSVLDITQKKAPASRPKVTFESTADVRIPGPGPELLGNYALGGACRDCFLLWDSTAKKNIELPVAPEATLFSLGRSTKKPTLAIALDDGQLLLYQLD